MRPGKHLKISPITSTEDHNEYSYTVTAKPSLRKAIGNRQYKTVLELHSQNRYTFDVLRERASLLYFACNTNKDMLTSLEHYHKRNPARPRTRVVFLERGISEVTTSHVMLDLVCIDSLRTEFIQSEEEVRKALKCLFIASTKIVIHVILAEALGTNETINTQILASSADIPRTVKSHFFPLILYMGIAVESRRRIQVYGGEPFEYQGTVIETNYLVFD